jgi:5-formyltetrahydrofolate cyclo-ligase
MIGADDDLDAAEDPASPACFLGELSGPAPDPQDWPAVARWRRADRGRLQAERLALGVEVRGVKAESLAAHLETFVASRLSVLAGRVVSGYWPIKGELDPRPWMTTLHEQGPCWRFLSSRRPGCRWSSAAGPPA